MKKILVAAIVFLTFGAFAGPLGFSQGMTLAEVQKRGKFVLDDPFVYLARGRIKGSNPEFVFHYVTVTPKEGLCKVAGTTDDIISIPSGDQVRAAFGGLAEALTEKYGKPSSEFDYVDSDSIWDKPKDWMTALSKGERKLIKIWSKEDGVNLPDSISGIMLQAGADRKNAGFVGLNYEFDNFEKCQNSIKLMSEKKHKNL